MSLILNQFDRMEKENNWFHCLDFPILCSVIFDESRHQKDDYVVWENRETGIEGGNFFLLQTVCVCVISIMNDLQWNF